MAVLRRVMAVLVVVIGIASAAAGATALWAHAQFDGPPTEATVLLSGQWLVDVQYGVGDERTRTAVWQAGDRPLIGDEVLVQTAPGRRGLARLAGDGRFGSYGLALLVVGTLLVAAVLAVVVLAQRRRRRSRVPGPLAAGRPDGWLGRRPERRPVRRLGRRPGPVVPTARGEEVSR